MKKIAGHVLLARLGKKRLRPGGIAATNWLIEKANLNEDTKVLEVACNMGTTLIEIAKKYKCNITGIDKDENFLNQAKENIKNANLESKVKLLLGDATKLPFEDETFDVVINEAMLTMLSLKDKEKAVKEYFRVLKKGGKLLTHDITIPKEDPEMIKKLRLSINVLATPLVEEKWLELFKNANFSKITTKIDHMTLMSKEGMQADEGVGGMAKIMENAKKDPNFAQFIEMKEFFTKNHDKLFYFAACSEK